LDKKHDVHIIDNLSRGKKENVPQGTTFYEIDAQDTAALTKIFAGATYVFHMAALPRVQYSIEHPLETNHNNVCSTVSVLAAAKEAKVTRVVYAASSSYYGNTDSLFLKEDMPARTMSPYALQKHIGELYCRLFSDIYQLPTVSLRYFNVYGPGMFDDGAYPLVIDKFIQQRQKGLPLSITGDGTQARDFTHVHDVVRANILAAESANVGNGEVLNIGTGKKISVNAIAAMIGGATEHIAPRIEPHDTLADNSLAKELLNWEPTITLEEGVAEMKQLSGIV